MTGAELEYRVTYPLKRPARNLTAPDWLYSEPGIVQMPIAGEKATQITYMPEVSASITIPTIR